MVARRAPRAGERKLRDCANAAALALGILLMPAVRAAFAHPLHTTLTQLSYDVSTRVLSVSVRAFTQDFSTAVMRSAHTGGSIPPDSAVLRYVGERFALQDPRGVSIPLRWCGMRRDGEAVFVCLRATAQPSPAGARLRNVLLGDVFADQVNIVQASYGGMKRTLLFTSRDGLKALP